MTLKCQRWDGGAAWMVRAMIGLSAKRSASPTGRCLFCTGTIEGKLKGSGMFGAYMGLHRALTSA